MKLVVYTPFLWRMGAHCENIPQDQSPSQVHFDLYYKNNAFLNM